MGAAKERMGKLATLGSHTHTHTHMRDAFKMYGETSWTKITEEMHVSVVEIYKQTRLFCTQLESTNVVFYLNLCAQAAMVLL